MSLRVAISKNAAPKLGVCCIVNTLTDQCRSLLVVLLCNFFFFFFTPPSVGQLLALNNVEFVVVLVSAYVWL